MPQRSPNLLRVCIKMVASTSRWDVLFRRVWVTAPAPPRLPPTVSARCTMHVPCAACHPNNGRGQPARREDGDDAMSLLLRIDIPPQDENQRQALARAPYQ